MFWILSNKLDLNQETRFTIISKVENSVQGSSCSLKFETFIFLNKVLKFNRL